MSNLKSITHPQVLRRAEKTGFTITIGDRFQSVPSGDYRAVVTRIEKRENKWKRPMFILHFEVVEGEFTGAKATGFLNAHYDNFSSFTKLRKWHAIVSGEDCSEAGEKLSLDDFLNKVLLVKTETKSSKQTGNEFSNVTEILKVICEL